MCRSGKLAGKNKQPQLVFLDEPTGGIDPTVRHAIWTEVRRLRYAGRTLIVTTQIVTEAEECDTVALITGGRLVACAAPEALRREAYGGELLEVERPPRSTRSGWGGSTGLPEGTRDGH